MRTTATKLKNNLGQYLESAGKEPVIIEKSGRANAVLISFETFEKFSHYEDFYWSMQAAAGEKTGYLGPEETAKRLKKYAERAGVVMEDEDENETVRHNKTSR